MKQFSCDLSPGVTNRMIPVLDQIPYLKCLRYTITIVPVSHVGLTLQQVLLHNSPFFVIALLLHLSERRSLIFRRLINGEAVRKGNITAKVLVLVDSCSAVLSASCNQVRFRSSVEYQNLGQGEARKYPLLKSLYGRSSRGLSDGNHSNKFRARVHADEDSRLTRLARRKFPSIIDEDLLCRSFMLSPALTTQI